MRKPMRNRKQRKFDSAQHHDEMSRSSPAGAAARQMIHKAYQSYTVMDYLDKLGVDVKGEMSDGG